MNVANLKLCKELYELSEFTLIPDTNQWHCEGVPAYDLGYLLRKMPAAITPAVDNKKVALKDMNTYFLFVQRTPDNYVASYNIIGNTMKFLYVKHGDTPEDATCKLCVELFKQGILKPRPKNIILILILVVTAFITWVMVWGSV